MTMNRRHALHALLQGAGATAALGVADSREAFAAAYGQQEPLAGAQSATRRGLPRLKIARGQRPRGDG